MNSNSFNCAMLYAVARILKTLLHFGPLSRTQISAHLHLDKATVSKVASRLLEKQILLSTGEGDISRKGGRRQIFLDLNPAHLKIAGIDTAGDNVYLRYYDFKGNILHDKSKIFPGAYSDETASLLTPELQKVPLLAGCGICGTENMELQGIPAIWASPERCVFAVYRHERSALLNLKQTGPERIRVSLWIYEDGACICPDGKDNFWEGSLNEFYSGAGFIFKAGGINRIFLYGLPEEAGITVANEIHRRTGTEINTLSLAAGSPVFTAGGAMLFLDHFLSSETDLLTAHLNPVARR